jgi:CheY-like chemotaxis protein
MRVLLLEDEQALNDIAAEQIRRQGHEVYTAVTIAEAEAILADPASRVDCLIADHRLPDGPGVALCVYTQKRFPRMAIGVVSACLTANDRAFLEQHGLPFWRKPVLYSKVMEVLGEKAKPPPVVASPPPNAPVLDRPLVEVPEESTSAQPWKLLDRFTAVAPADTNGPSWPSAVEEKQRLNHANHLATPPPFPVKAAEEPARKGLTRRLFALGGKT